jgi:hypothetical protein
MENAKELSQGSVISGTRPISPTLLTKRVHLHRTTVVNDTEQP